MDATSFPRKRDERLHIKITFNVTTEQKIKVTVNQFNQSSVYSEFITLDIACSFINKYIEHLQFLANLYGTIYVTIINNITSTETLKTIAPDGNLPSMATKSLKKNVPLVALPLDYNGEMVNSWHGTIILAKAGDKFTGRIVGNIKLMSIWATDTKEELMELVEKVKCRLKTLDYVGALNLEILDNTGE